MITPQITLKVGKEIPEDQLLSLYESCQWYAYTQGRRRSELQQAVRDSTYVVTAWAGSKLIGLPRSLSDNSTILYLQDILVRPEFQRKSIGRQLLENCLERFKHVRSRVLLTDDEEKQIQFYESLGFKNTKDFEETTNTFVL